MHEDADNPEAHRPLETQRAGMEQKPASAAVAADAALRHGNTSLFERVLRTGPGIGDDDKHAVHTALEGLTEDLIALADESLEVEVWAEEHTTAGQIVHLAVRGADGLDLEAHATNASLATALGDASKEIHRALEGRRSRESDHNR